MCQYTRLYKVEYLSKQGNNWEQIMSNDKNILMWFSYSEQAKAQICCRSIAGIVGLKSAEDTGYSSVVFVVCCLSTEPCDGLITRWEESYRSSVSNCDTKLQSERRGEVLYTTVFILDVYYAYLPIPLASRRRSSAVRLLGLRIQVPSGAWMSASGECCVL
jgi:hypothetical protein